MVSSFEVEVFYDGACPLCVREIGWLRRLDRQHRIRFTDITLEAFDAGALGVSWHALMDRIHGRLAVGTMLEGVEVFRRLYAAVGFRRLARATRLPGISQLLDLTYRLFAKNRLKLTGRCSNDACILPGTAARPTEAPRSSGEC